MKFHGTGIAIILILTIFLFGTLQAAPGQGNAGANNPNKHISSDVDQLVGTLRASKSAAGGQGEGKPARTVYKKSGYLRSLGAPEDHVFPVKGAVAGDPAATAKNFIGEHGKAFGIVSKSVDFAIKKSKKKNGRNYERFTQTYAGIPVFGGEMIVQLDDADGVLFVLSDIMTDTAGLDNGQVPVSPGITAEDAADLAISLMASEHPGTQFNNSVPQLMIYQPEVVGNTGSTCLVWHTVVKSVGVYEVDEVILINARTGEVALRFSQIKHARNREIYDANSTDQIPGTLERAEGDPASGIADVDTAYDFLGDTYDFYFNENGRDSIDNAGMTMIATVRACPYGDLFCPFPNAYWDGFQMVFGEGFTVDDVTAHELTHGVTDYESNLIYMNESGAINESFSDMWGEWVDLTNGAGTDTPEVRWLMGEDVPGMGAIRNMADPTQFGDPDSKCSIFWFTGTGDNGGVHYNSGVGNKLCYLLTDGDTFKDVEITGMGISAIADLMYECQTNLLTASSNYADFHVALTQAAINLGWTVDERLNLEKACLVTELSKCFDPADLILGIVPDPMEWEIEPVAVGENTIYMKSVTASHAAGVQYYFDCETDPANFEPGYGKDWYGDTQFDSGDPADPNGWVSGTVNYRGDYEKGVGYYFRVRARNMENGDETEWSEIIGPITPDSGLPPYPNPAQWDGTPRKVSNGRIAMEAVEGHAEAVLQDGQWVSVPIEYYFDCIETDDSLFADADELDSGWQSSVFYQRTVSRISSPGTYYKFNLKMRAVDVETDLDPLNERTAYMAPPQITREVPTATYPTIQDAVDASNHGDIVLVHRGVYRETNINLKGKAITVKSENPEDPAVVAATVIDCAEVDSNWFHEQRRAFLIQNGEGRDTVISGITIRNATAYDDPEVSFSIYFGINDRRDPAPTDGEDALGGAILIGTDHSQVYDPNLGIWIESDIVIPASPTIRNCVFVDCFAHGGYGGDGPNAPGAGNDSDGLPGQRGGHGGNAYGGAIYVYQGGSPLIKGCQFTNCQAIGGDAGNGGNGSNGGGHSQGAPDPTPGWRGGDGGDAGSGGCAWGGAIYFEPNCLPELYGVTIQNCLVQIGEAGSAGNGGNGSNAKGNVRGGHGGNGGVGGDLRAPDSSGGAVYFGDNTKVVIDSCQFENCRVVATLSGDYSGGDGGNGGNGNGGAPGGFGGHGGPAFMIPPKMTEIGGVNATGGTGGNSGAPASAGGNGGFRFGQGGSPGGADFGGHTGIFPSNIYYMAYYWEDTMNVYNPPLDPNDHSILAYGWEWEPILMDVVQVDYPDPIDPNVILGTYDREIYDVVTIFDTSFSPYFGFLHQTAYLDPTITIGIDPNTNEPTFEVDYDNLVAVYPVSAYVVPLTPTDPNHPNAGACAGANFYGRNCVVEMRDSTVSGNNSFANHGGGELYDKGCSAEFDNCTYENNQTLLSTAVTNTDFRYEGMGGAIYADQPVRLVFNECDFNENNAYSGAGIYCNLAPSDPNSQLDPGDPNYVTPANFELTDCTFTGNAAVSHFMYSYGGAVYVGNSLDSYEEYFFNYFKDHRYNTFNDYFLFFWQDPQAIAEFSTFIGSFYDQYHGSFIGSDPGIVNFMNPITTQLWDDEPEADHILWHDSLPVYSVSVEGCTFTENQAPYGASLYADASLIDINGSQFTKNIGEVGVGAYVFASDALIQDNLYAFNIGTEIESLGNQSEQDKETVDVYCNGGGLYVSNSNLDLVDNRFTGNAVEGFAGAVFINGPSLDWYPQNLINNLFVENSSGLQGGAMVAAGASDVLLQNSTFIDNSVSNIAGVGGSILAHDTFVDVINSIFWNSEAFYPGAVWGPQIAVGDRFEEVQEYDPNYIPYSTVFVTYSDVQGGEDDIFVANGEGPWLWYNTATNIEDDPATEEIDEADPLFAAMSDPNDASEGTCYLSHVAAGQLVDSPCLNRGTGTIADLSSVLGFDPTTRTDHVADADPIDIGYHCDSSLPVKEYILRTNVVVPDRFPHGTLVVTTEPNNLLVEIDPETSTYLYKFKQGTVVELLAIPDENYRVKEWVGADNTEFYYDKTNTITMTGYETVKVEFEVGVPKNLYVPSGYASIEEAVLAARTDDRIILEPRPNEPYLISAGDGINFEGKNLTVTSLDPNDPAIVAATIIDCQGNRYRSKRAFHFESGEDANSIIEGITIRNAFTAVIGLSGVVDTGRWPWPFENDPTPLPPFRALSGEDAIGDSYGGAILIENDSSPIIRNCVFEGCTVAGGIGGDGLDGNYPAGLINVSVDLDSQSGGHGGNGFGNGYGGAVAIRDNSNPKILNCLFLGNRATGGWGGVPGDAGTPYNNGRYGWGGDAGNGIGDGRGGAIFVGVDCDPTILNCAFEGNVTSVGFVSQGGEPSLGGSEYPEPWDADPWALDILRRGSDGFASSSGKLAGGAIYFEREADFVLDTCVFNHNSAEIGGAIYADPNVVLVIQNSTFSNQIGGAVFTNSYADLEIDRCDFLNNDANQLANGVGGAITIGVDAIQALITDCNFVGNSTIDDGGAIVTYSDLFVQGSEFVDNTAASDGGAFYAYLAPDPNVHTLQVELQDCEFRGNEAQDYGGAGFARNTILIAEDCRFFFNTAAGGGALRIPMGDLTLHRCMVIANEAVGTATGADGYGGGVHMIDGPFEITDSRFELNKSSAWGAAGGGLCVTGSQEYYTRTITDSLFAKNRADGSGGAIALLQYVNGNPDVLVNNCTIANNVSRKNRGGGVFLEYNSAVEINNSIVSGNIGFGVYESSSCNSKADNTLFFDNLEGDLRDAQTQESISGESDLEQVPGYMNILEDDPQFTDGPWGAYYHTIANLGYQYPAPVGDPQFTLTASVINDRRGTVVPTSGTYIPYAVAELNAIPDPNYQVYHWFGTDDDDSKQLFNGVLMVEDRIVKVEFEGAGPKNRYVPEAYNTIEEAMAVARSGDRIVLSPRPDQPYTITNPDGINFGGRQLVFTSIDPDDPEVIASTIINCQGSRYNSKRAFHFESGEDANSIIEGVTIRNAFTAVIGQSAVIFTGRWPWHDGPLDPDTDPWNEDQPSPDPLPPYRALSGEDASGDSYGGAILFENGSSPIIRNCVFENCTVAGAVGGDGEDGAYPPDLINVTDDLDSQSGGHSGKGEGDGYGGAIAVLSGSSPRILNCQFIGNRATGGWGGIPGDAGQSYNAGRWGWGGNDWAGLSYAARSSGERIQELLDLGIPIDDDLLQTNDWFEAGNGFGDGHGGAIYVEAGCEPNILECYFEGNYARPGYVSPGGSGAGGAVYPEPFDGARPPVAWGEQGARDGSDGILTNDEIIAGGAVFFASDTQGKLVGCTFAENSAYDVQGPSDAPSYTRGGAVHMDPNAVVEIVSCDFMDNIAGALFSSTNTSLMLNYCNFHNNTTTSLEEDSFNLLDYFLGQDLDVIGDVVERDIAGAVTIDVAPATPARIDNCTFIGNRTDYSGAAILTNGDIEVTNSLFNANIANGDGGAFYSYYDIPDPNWHTIRLRFEDCEFSGNESETGFGGAGFVRTGVLDMYECYLIKNKATSGGGLYTVLSDLMLQGMLFCGNEAMGIDTGTHRSIVGEGKGGGIFVSDSTFVIADARFQDNIARGLIASGGGLCITGEQQYQQQNLLNCLFSGNLSENVGGGIACNEYVDLRVDNCTIADNTSDSQKGGGVFIDHLSKITVNNSILTGNSGYGIYEKQAGGSTNSGGESDARYTLFYGNTAADLFDAQANQGVSGAASLRSIAGYGVSGQNDILDDYPEYKNGPFDGYYLSQSEPKSPAIDAGSGTPRDVSLYDPSRIMKYTTDPSDPMVAGTVIEDGGADGESDPVDLGFHYYIPDPDTQRFHLTALVEGDHGDVGVWDEDTGMIVPQISESYYLGKIVKLTADVDKEYFLTSWSGGTINDSSREAENVVLMTRDKVVEVSVRLRRTLNVGESSDYATLGQALDDALDGDVILVAPGQYTAASQYPSPLNNITLDGKSLTISGFNPDDGSVVRSTVFHQYDFILNNLDETTTIEGITFDSSQMDLTDASPIIRNCVFSNNNFFRIDPEHPAPVDAGTDGFTPYQILGGAIQMFNSSPKVMYCIFEDNSVTGGDGEDGYAGSEAHPNGGDGGWPGAAYGGAVYCGLSSNPEFISCTFSGNEAIGGNGGNGADFITISPIAYYGGRGGGWVYDDVTEEFLRNLPLAGGWDGWAYNSIGNKYGIVEFLGIQLDFGTVYSDYYGEYDLDVWSRWFNWSEDIASWDDFFDNLPNDPYDQMLDVWRHSGYGGAVYCELDSHVTFEDCVFENNQSHGGLTGVGGAQDIDTLPTGVPWPDRQLNMPTAGGAVFAALDSELTFTNCTFSNNTADTSTVDLPHTFQVSFGGAVAYEYNCKVTFDNCDIQNNTATVGGGIYGFDSNSLNVVDCNVFDNEAYIGAGVFSDDQRAWIEGTTFRANRAKAPSVVIEPPADDNTGGQNQQEPVVEPATLDSTGEGAGLFAQVQDLEIRDCAFVENKAGLSGGGLSLSYSGGVDDPANVFNCLFAENTAGRDGAGASVNWVSRARFGNCTFADNTSLGIFQEVETGEFTPVLDENGEPVLDEDNNPVFDPVTTLVQTSLGFGGGLSVSYDSVAEAIDSIFWLNLADRGENIYVGSDPVAQIPSELTISYSDVGNYPGANAIYVEDGSVLNTGQGIFNDNPDFVTLPAATDDEVAPRYYLDQQTSSAVNKGSDFASAESIGLSDYTTSIYGASDKGIVDVGYHYRKAAVISCRRADLILSGMIDIADLAMFASQWLNSCGEGDGWCSGADQNFNTIVDFEDFVNMASCWQTEDTEPPFPSPAEWALVPRAVEETFDTIEMAAKVHHDAWWPDEFVKYRFYSGSQQNPDILYVDQDTNHDGFLTYDELDAESKDPDGINVVRIYATKSGLVPSSYSLFVQAFDGSDNATGLSSQIAPVTPGEGTELPAAQWLNPPFVATAQFAIGMEALAYEDFGTIDITVPTLPAGYVIRYQFDYTGTAEGGDGRVYELDPVYVDVGMVEGQTYSYRTRMGLFYEPGDGSSVKIKDGEWSEEASIVAEGPDLYPPLPDPAEHDTGSPFELFVAAQGVYYHVVTAVAAEDVLNAAGDLDPDNVEYKFVCSNSFFSSGNEGDPDQIEWRNVDNVADLFYPNGEPQTPEQYWAKRGLGSQQDGWVILVRDRSPNQNATAPSESRTISTPAP